MDAFSPMHGTEPSLRQRKASEGEEAVMEVTGRVRTKGPERSG